MGPGPPEKGVKKPRVPAAGTGLRCPEPPDDPATLPWGPRAAATAPTTCHPCQPVKTRRRGCGPTPLCQPGGGHCVYHRPITKLPPEGEEAVPGMK